MSTSVKLSHVDKEKLEKLQALITLKAGEKLTQQELLSTLIGEALCRGDEFVEKFSGSNQPISDEEYQRVLTLVEDWGIETTWREVDEVLYGSKKRHRRKGS